MKKIITIILSICILLSIGSVIASADTIYYFGDVNKSGSETIDSADLTYLIDILLETKSTNEMADINGDETVSILDLVSLKKIIANPNTGVNISYGAYTDITDTNS